MQKTIAKVMKHNAIRHGIWKKHWFCDVYEPTDWAIQHPCSAESNNLPQPRTLSQVSKFQEDVTV